MSLAQRMRMSIQRGITAWDVSALYDIGDSAERNGTVYYSYSDGNIGNDPAASFLWMSAPPTSARYYATYSDYTGGIAASRNAAAYLASLVFPYHSYETRRLDNGFWLEFNNIHNSGDAFYGAYTVYAMLYFGLAPAGLTPVGAVIQTE